MPSKPYEGIPGFFLKTLTLQTLIGDIPPSSRLPQLWSRESVTLLKATTGTPENPIYTPPFLNLTPTTPRHLYYAYIVVAMLSVFLQVS